MKKQEVIGIFGGAFDPPHFGHLQAAHDILEAFSPRGVISEQLAIKHLVFLPAGCSPLKQGPYFDAAKRLEWLNFFVGQSPHRSELSVNDDEINFTKSNPGKPNYTTETLDRLSRHYAPSDLLFIIGTDQLAQLSKWHKFPHFLSKCHWVILLRHHSKSANRSQSAPDFTRTLRDLQASGIVRALTDNHYLIGSPMGSKPRHLFLLPTQAPAVSSSEIRQALALGNGADWQPYFPKELWSDLEKAASYAKKETI